MDMESSMSRLGWALDQCKRRDLSCVEKLILIALADYPSDQEHVIENFGLDQAFAEAAFTELLLKGLIQYHEGAAYVYEIKTSKG